MSSIQITTDEIKEASGQKFQAYIKSITQTQKPFRHRYYKNTVDHAKSMGVHIEGFEPTELLKKKRPNEPKEVRDYRISTWKNVTESQSEKIINTVNRIFNPKFFRITFPERPNLIPEGEDLATYLNEDYGVYRNIWIFIRETLLKLTFSDPNSVCVVFPENINAEDTEFYRPLPIIYRADSVVDFVDGEYYTIYVKEHKKKNEISNNKGKLMILDTESVRVWDVDGNKVKPVMDFNHDLGVVPAFRLGGKVMGSLNPYYYSSFVAGIQPHWDKAITMISDADGSIVNHLFPERYEWQESCNTCNGKGRIDRALDRGKVETISCQTCSGTGWVTNKSPYGIISIKRDAINPDVTPPTPPAAYITKDIEPLRELRKVISDEIMAGFSAINMDILHKVGENQSGVAKTIDRQDMDSFFDRISNHVFDYQLKNIIDFTARWRMSNILNPNALNDYIKSISISKPKEFNVLGMDMLIEELKEASNANVSANYIKHIETELINTKYSNNDRERKINLAIIKLKPWPNMTTDELLSSLAADAITKKDFIRNQNIDDLVMIAIERDENFLELSFTEQLDAINEIIEEKYLQDEPVSVPVEPLAQDE